MDIPRVVINAGILIYDTRNPFREPIAIPMIKLTKIPVATLPVDTMTMAMDIEDIPRILPTERSIPPVSITKVCPMDKIAMIATCDATLLRFCAARKYCDMMHISIKNATIIIPIANSVRYFVLITFKFVVP